MYNEFKPLFNDIIELKIGFSLKIQVSKYILILFKNPYGCPKTEFNKCRSPLNLVKPPTTTKTSDKRTIVGKLEACSNPVQEN